MAYERAGAHKILFGSDGPWLHPGVELAKILYLKASPQDQALMLSGNFLRLTRQVRSRQRLSKPQTHHPQLHDNRRLYA
jgi:hypothetical protein